MTPRVSGKLLGISLSTDIFTLLNFVAGVLVVWVAIGYENSLSVKIHTDFPNGKRVAVEKNASGFSLCQFPRMRPLQYVSSYNTRVMLAQLLLYGNSEPGYPWGNWNQNFTQKIVDFQLQFSLDDYSQNDPEFVLGDLNDLTWRAMLISQWNQTEASRCAFECALSIPDWSDELSPTYNPYTDCCMDHQTDEAWFTEQIAVRQTYSRVPANGIIDCGVPTAFVRDVPCIYLSCVEANNVISPNYQKKKRQISFTPDEMTITQTVRFEVINPIKEYEFKLFPLFMLFLIITVLSGFGQIILLKRSSSFREEVFELCRNWFRWLEYSISAGVMLVVIALMSGIGNLWTLTSLFFSNLFLQMIGGYYFEKINSTALSDPKLSVNWAPFWIGSIVFGFPWIIIFVYFFVIIFSDASSVPGFVYSIIFVLFFFYSTFTGPILWRYGYAKRSTSNLVSLNQIYHISYIALSATSKNTLWWLLLGGMLREA